MTIFDSNFDKKESKNMTPIFPSSSTKGTTKSQGQKHSLDKFYTKPEIAKECIQKLDLKKYARIIEPSAGSGAFSNQIDNCEAYDLEPEHSSITRMNWFDYQKDHVPEQKILVIGNPPFGQQNALAIKFINHAAKFADTIAFILPLSFMKESVQNRVDLNFHLKLSKIIEKNSFTLDNADIDVPCVYQIWERQSEQRKIAKKIFPKGFDFVSKNKSPDFFIQRVGGRAGNIGTDWEGKSEQSNYFIKVDKPSERDILFKALSKLKFSQKDYSVGPRSISKQELLTELSEAHPGFTK